MGIKEILNKHIYKNKYLLKRPDPRPFIFPQGTYAIPTSKNSNQQHHTWKKNLQARGLHTECNQGAC